MLVHLDVVVLLMMVAAVISLVVFLGLYLVAQLRLSTSLKVAIHGFVVLLFLSVLFAFRKSENYKYHIPSWEDRISDDFYVGWLYISGTSAIFSWLSYVAMVYNHLQVEIPSLYGKNLRRDTIFLMGFFPLNATLAALLLFCPEKNLFVTIVSALNDVFMLFFLNRIMFGYCGGWSNAHQILSQLR